MGEDFKILLEAIIDNSSLSDVQKQLAKKTLKIGIEVDQAKSKKLVSDLQKINQVDSIRKWTDNNTKAVKKFGSEIDTIIKKLESVDDMTRDDFNNLKKQFKDIQVQARQTGNLGMTAFDKMKIAIEKFGGWSIATGAVMKGVTEIREAFSEMIKIDTYLTEISKANDTLGKSQLAQIGVDSYDVGSKYGKKATNYLSAMQTASRAGYDNAEDIAELSVAVQGAGDVTEDVANSYVIATDKAYKLNGEVSKLTEIFDGSNKITNENAVSMQDLADAMSIVGTTSASFGIEANQNAAALGTMIAVTQQTGSEAARAYRAILLNIRQVSDEEEGINAEGLTKYEKACNALNVKLKETKNGILQLRDPMKVLKELSVEYNKLDESDIRRTNLLSSLGSKLRSTQLDALLSNWDMYEKMLQDYANGEGSMAREAEKTAKSWEGSLNKVSNSWVKLVDSFTNQDAFIEAINIFSDFLELTTKAVDKFGALTVAGTALGAGLAFKNIGRDKMHSLKHYHCFKLPIIICVL